MLRTYNNPQDHQYVSVHSADVRVTLAVNMKPGDFVKHRSLGGFGILVANGDDFITILWSQVPNIPDPSDFAPRKDIITRYPRFYGRISILDNVPSGSK